MSGDFAWHGGRLEEARRVFGNGLRPWLDLSTGINPAPWPGVEALRFDWQVLPDPAALQALEAQAARYFDVDPAFCCALPGSEIGLRLLGTIIDLPGRFRDPCYRTHASIFPESGSACGPLDQGEATALVIANPNNPDGVLSDPTLLRGWLAAQEAAEGWLIVDEAFVDPIPAASMAQEVAAERALIVMRSFGKFFGLAGVRLGFAIAPPALVAALRQRLGDWPLSAAAMAIGLHAYADQQWIARTRGDLVGRAARFDATLLRCGFSPQGQSSLFRLIETARAPGLFERLARQQILTRPFADRPKWLRFGVPASEDDLKRVEQALTNV